MEGRWDCLSLRVDVDCPDMLEAFNDDDSPHLMTTLLSKELFLLLTLNLPSHVFVYEKRQNCIIWCHCKELALSLHYCPEGHLEVSSQSPCHHLNQSQRLPSASCSSDPQHGKILMVLRGSLVESEWPGSKKPKLISCHPFAVTWLPPEQNKEN